MCYNWWNRCVLNKDGVQICVSGREEQELPGNPRLCSTAQVRGDVACPPRVREKIVVSKDKWQPCADHNGHGNLQNIREILQSSLYPRAHGRKQQVHGGGSILHTSFRPPPAIKLAKVQCKGGWCEICQKELSSSRRLLDHLGTHDHSPEMFECSHIGCEAPLYTTKEALVRHKRIHESRTVVIVYCEYCAYKCHKDDLKSHQSSKRYREVRARKADTAATPSKIGPDPPLSSALTQSQQSTTTAPLMQPKVGHYCVVLGCLLSGVDFRTPKGLD